MFSAAPPTSLVPRSTPTIMPLAAFPRSPPTCAVPWITPRATSDTALVAALPTSPVLVRRIPSTSLTVSMTAFRISPVPLMVPMIPFFTESRCSRISMSSPFRSETRDRPECARVAWCNNPSIQFVERFGPDGPRRRRAIYLTESAPGEGAIGTTSAGRLATSRRRGRPSGGYSAVSARRRIDATRVGPADSWRPAR